MKVSVEGRPYHLTLVTRLSAPFSVFCVENWPCCVGDVVSMSDTCSIKYVVTMPFLDITT